MTKKISKTIVSLILFSYFYYSFYFIGLYLTAAVGHIVHRNINIMLSVAYVFRGLLVCCLLHSFAPRRVKYALVPVILALLFVFLGLDHPLKLAYMVFGALVIFVVFDFIYDRIRTFRTHMLLSSALYLYPAALHLVYFHVYGMNSNSEYITIMYKCFFALYVMHTALLFLMKQKKIIG